jgi:hypothetical protein
MEKTPKYGKIRPPQPRFSIYLAKRRRRSTKDKLFLKEGVVPIWWVMLFLLL